MMSNRLEGRCAVVTGAGRGIGKAVALALAAQGAKVVVNDPGANVDGTGFDNGPADQVADEINAAGGAAVPNYDSVSSGQGGENIIKACAQSFGRVDILVNSAGILRDRMIFNMSEEEWDSVLTVHLKGHFATTKAAAVLMRQQRFGRIINFSSSSGLMGNSGQANYGSAKAGIAGFTRVIARDLGRYGITANAIAPAADTRMTGAIPQESRELRARTGISTTFGSRLANLVERTPEHIAPMVAYLAGDEAWNINGQIFYVAGGIISLAAQELPIRSIRKNGRWTLEELAALVPSQLILDATNPAPPAESLEIPGRP